MHNSTFIYFEPIFINFRYFNFYRQKCYKTERKYSLTELIDLKKSLDSIKIVKLSLLTKNQEINNKLKEIKFLSNQKIKIKITSIKKKKHYKLMLRL